MRLLNQARDKDRTVAPIRLADLSGVDAVFATNAVVGTRPVTRIDQTHWPTEHPVLRALRKQYVETPAEPL